MLIATSRRTISVPLPRKTQVHVCCDGVVINDVPFHSQKYSSLDNK